MKLMVSFASICHFCVLKSKSIRSCPEKLIPAIYRPPDDQRGQQISLDPATSVTFRVLRSSKRIERLLGS